MKAHDFALITLGGVGGFLFCRIADWSSLTLGDLVSAGATLVAAYFVQRALTNRAELNRIPLATAERIVGRLDERVAAALRERDGQEQLQLLRDCGNEIHLLQTLMAAVGVDKAAGQVLLDRYFDLKSHLTDSVPDRVEAERAGRLLRLQAMRVQWELSRRVVDNPEALLSEQ